MQAVIIIVALIWLAPLAYAFRRVCVRPKNKYRKPDGKLVQALREQGQI